MALAQRQFRTTLAELPTNDHRPNSGLREGGRAAYGQEIRHRIHDWLGLAVCVGIGPTSTTSMPTEVKPATSAFSSI